MNRLSIFGALGAALVLGFGARRGEPAVADDIGSVHFSVSCNASVQDDFDRAVALLHHMMYVEARAAFEEIAERDAGCAMAHWGVAMTLFQPLWPSRPTPADLSRGSIEVRRALALGVGTDRERDLVVAAKAFYANPDSADWWGRLHRWAAAMAEAYQRRPDDFETAAFYALSQLAIAPVSDERMARQAHAAEVLVGLYDRDSRHPGAIHYTIHANDVQGRATETLHIVRSYGAIAPSVPHALHMPTHVFVRLGSWPDVIEWNRRSAAAALQYPAGEATSHHYVHAVDYLVYAYLQRGADASAAAVIEEAQAYTRHQPTFVSAFHLAAIPARYAVERRDWGKAASVEVRAHDYLPWERFWWPEAMSWFARGVGAARLGDLDAAREAVARMAALRDRARAAGEEGFATYIETDRLVAAGWIAYAEGNVERAVALLREGAAAEAGVEKHPVTPGTLMPPNEALGDLLLEAKRPAEALEAFGASLRIWPNRFHSLLGAARAARGSGDDELARTYYEALLAVVGDSETRRGAVDEARAMLGDDPGTGP